MSGWRLLGLENWVCLVVNSLALFWPEIVLKSPYCGCQFEGGGSEDPPQKRRANRSKNRTLTDANRRYVGVDGRFSAVKRRHIGGYRPKEGQGI